MKVAIIGTGYVGLVSGACFSEFGVHVTCVDTNKDKIARLNQGEIPIFEPGLENLVQKNRAAKRLFFTTELAPAVQAADAVFIAVGTPSAKGGGRRGSGHADLSYVFSAVEKMASFLKDYTVVVTKSTVPVGTSRKIEAIIRTAVPDADFDVCSNPEFLREGSAINDFMRPDRIVIGTDSKRAERVMRALYRPLHLAETPLMVTGRATAELVKYASNAFLATKITFINEIADLCEKVGADVQEVAKGMGLDQRIGRKFLHAGPGYGGSCFPKDTTALLQTAQDHEVSLKIVENVIAVNEDRKAQMADRIIEACGGDAKGKTIGILGLTFKPNTDDMRDAPSLTILPALQKAGAAIQAYDPEGMMEAQKFLEGIDWKKDAYEAAEHTDCLVILTEWNEFRALNLKHLKTVMNTPILVDLRNIYKPEDLKRAGFMYHSIGR